MYVTEYNVKEVLPIEQQFTNEVDNENEIPAIVKNKSYNLIQFSQSMPSGNYYKLDHSSLTWSIFKIVSRDPATLIIKVRGVQKDPLVVPESGAIDWT